MARMARIWKKMIYTRPNFRTLITRMQKCCPRNTRSTRMTKICTIKLFVDFCVFSGRTQAQFFSLLSPGFVAKTLPRHELGEGCLNKNPQEPSDNMVRSIWRRLKENIKEAIIRD